jgi:hypothetical protein
MSRLKGMTIDGFGGVSGRSREVLSLLAVPASLDYLQLTRRGMLMKFSINRTVDCSGLEAGVGVTKRYRGCHRSRVVW